MATEIEATLGCSKCRYSKRGCKRCRDPAFQKRQHESDAPTSRQQRPAKRHKAGSRETSAAAQPKGKAPPAQSTRSQARSAKGKHSSLLPDKQEHPKAAPAQKDSLSSAGQHSASKSLDLDEAQQNNGSADFATTGAADADAHASQPDADSQPQTQAAAGAQHQPNKAAPEPSKAAAAPKEAEPSALAPSLKSSPAEPASTSPAADAARSSPSRAQAASPAGPSAAAATIPTQPQSGSVPAKQLDDKSAGLSAAAASASPQPHSPSGLADQQATPGPASQQDGKTAGLGPQGTASDSSRPSFLAMLQSKMDKRRQERWESQSAGSASDSSMSSVQAAGTSSAGKAGASVDSGTQAPQAVHAPRHKVKQQKRRSTKKAPAKTRAFLQRGPDPRQALWHPPASPYGLIEEYLYEDPWKLLVACMLLNVTSGFQLAAFMLLNVTNGFQVRKVIWKLFEIWPTAETAAGASDDTMVVVEKLIQPLGLFRKRTIAVKRFSQEYLETDWLDPIELHGIGQYASDAYFMFCRGNWQDVEPSDKDLLKYQKWLHSTGGEGTGLERDAMPEATSASKVDAPFDT